MRRSILLAIIAVAAIVTAAGVLAPEKAKSTFARVFASGPSVADIAAIVVPKVVNHAKYRGKNPRADFGDLKVSDARCSQTQAGNYDCIVKFSGENWEQFSKRYLFSSNNGNWRLLYEEDPSNGNPIDLGEL